MVTGLFHNQRKETLVAGLLVDASKRQLTGPELMDAINAVRVRWQPSRTKLVKADGTALNIFQSFVMSREWKLQRYGILYGKMDPENSTVSVHCIYEPEQQGSEHSFELLPDSREATVDAIAAGLGLRRVGSVCTHSPRDEASVTLSGKELLLCAKDQSRYGDGCVLITLGPNVETGLIQAQCWQASEACVRFYRMGVLSEDKSDIKHIISSIPLEIAQEDRDKAGHQRCVIKESSTVVDTRWMTGYVAVEAFQSDVIGNGFIRISRPGCEPPTFANLKVFFSDPKRNKLPFVQQLADFHVLIFLAASGFLDVTHDMPVLVEAVAKKDNGRVALYEELIREFIKASSSR